MTVVLVGIEIPGTHSRIRTEHLPKLNNKIEQQRTEQITEQKSNNK
jgi:hypothetical protein